MHSEVVEVPEARTEAEADQLTTPEQAENTEAVVGALTTVTREILIPAATGLLEYYGGQDDPSLQQTYLQQHLKEIL